MARKDIKDITEKLEQGVKEVFESDRYKDAIRLFNKEMSLETSVYADSKADYLVKEFGYTPEQIEAIELTA